jgi:hypothetical protein
MSMIGYYSVAGIAGWLLGLAFNAGDGGDQLPVKCEAVVTCQVLVAVTPGANLLGPMLSGSCKCDDERACLGKSCHYDVLIGIDVPPGGSAQTGGVCSPLGLVMSPNISSRTCGSPTQSVEILEWSEPGCPPRRLARRHMAFLSCEISKCADGTCP